MPQLFDNDGAKLSKFTLEDGFAEFINMCVSVSQQSTGFLTTELNYEQKWGYGHYGTTYNAYKEFCNYLYSNPQTWESICDKTNKEVVAKGIYLSLSTAEKSLMSMMNCQIYSADSSLSYGSSYNYSSSNSSSVANQADAIALTQILFTAGVVWEVVAAQKAAKNMLRPEGSTTKIFGLTVSSNRIRALAGWAASLVDMLVLAAIMNVMIPRTGMGDQSKADRDVINAYFNGLGLDKANTTHLLIWSLLLLSLRELFDQNNILRRVAKPVFEKFSNIHAQLPTKLQAKITSNNIESFLRIYVPIIMIVNSQSSIFYNKNDIKFSPLTELLSGTVNIDVGLSDFLLYAGYSLWATFAYKLTAGKLMVCIFDAIGECINRCKTPEQPEEQTAATQVVPLTVDLLEQGQLASSTNHENGTQSKAILFRSQANSLTDTTNSDTVQPIAQTSDREKIGPRNAFM